VSASTDDGIQLQELKTLVKPMDTPRNRNQNPKLFLDPIAASTFSIAATPKVASTSVHQLACRSEILIPRMESPEFRFSDALLRQ